MESKGRGRRRTYKTHTHANPSSGPMLDAFRGSVVQDSGALPRGERVCVQGAVQWGDWQAKTCLYRLSVFVLCLEEGMGGDGVG